MDNGIDSGIDIEKARNAITDLLTAFGVDEGAHTADTPSRVAKAWAHTLRGYTEDPRIHLEKVFPAPHDPGLVMVSGIAVRSTCAHHLLPITGTATVAYRPAVGQPVVGLSKLARLLEGYAARLQVQERLGAQVANALFDTLAPLGAACVISAAHGCISLRGVQQHDALTTTYALAGAWTPGDPDVEAVAAEHRRTVK